MSILPLYTLNGCSLPLLSLNARTTRMINGRVPHSPLQRVLVADDFPQQAEMIGKWLRRRGYTVKTANDGMEALEIADAFMPDANSSRHSHAEARRV
jgi:PleD family two-component response regulator